MLSLVSADMQPKSAFNNAATSFMQDRKAVRTAMYKKVILVSLRRAPGKTAESVMVLGKLRTDAASVLVTSDSS